MYITGTSLWSISGFQLLDIFQCGCRTPRPPVISLNEINQNQNSSSLVVAQLLLSPEPASSSSTQA